MVTNVMLFIVCYKERVRRTLLGLSLVLTALTACGGDGDGDGDDMTATPADEAQCESAKIEVVDACFTPNGVDIIEDADRSPILDIVLSAVELEGGFYLPKVGAGDAAGDPGFIFEDNETCRVACLVQCDITVQSLCITSLSPGEGDQTRPSGCYFCGQFTGDECQEFLSACNR